MLCCRKGLSIENGGITMKRISLFAAMWLCFLLLIPLVVCADTDTLHEPSGNEIQAE